MKISEKQPSRYRKFAQGGSTFLSGGWLKGCEEVALGATEQTINRTLLLTDGLADAALAGMITHNDPASNACCVAFTYLLWECLRTNEIPEPAWWLDTFTSIACQLEGETQYRSRCEGNPYQGTMWQFVDQEVRQALAENRPTLAACEQWHLGAYLLETMPCVLYIF